MKILIFPYQLVMSGTVVNAIDLAAALRDLHGFDVVLFATPGPLVKLVEEKDLRFLPAPSARFHPAPARMSALRDAVRSERPDLVYVWDWMQCIDAYYAHLMMRVPMAVTDMSMSLPHILPKSLPTTFGTPELVDQARASGRQRVELLLPPVNVHRNAPGAVDPRIFREQYGIEDGDIAVVTVSRFDEWMKAESLVRTVDAIRVLGRDFPLRLVLVGDGSARSKLESLAGETNSELGRPAVVLTGELLDPRPAYAAADIVVGMGGSALRGMAFGKPVIVVGKRSFSAPLTPETARFFLYNGIYGCGDGSSSTARLVASVRHLTEHREERLALGRFARQFVLDHFSLEKVCAGLAVFCRHSAAGISPFHVTAADGIRTAAVYLRERRFSSGLKGPWRFGRHRQPAQC